MAELVTARHFSFRHTEVQRRLMPFLGPAIRAAVRSAGGVLYLETPKGGEQRRKRQATGTARSPRAHFGDGSRVEDLAQTDVDGVAAARRSGVLHANLRTGEGVSVCDGTVRQSRQSGPSGYERLKRDNDFAGRSDLPVRRAGGA